MTVRAKLALIAGILTLLGAAPSKPDRSSNEVASSQTAPVTYDDLLVRIGDRIPEFGGLYVGDDDVLLVILAQDVRSLSGDARQARTAEVRAAIVAVLGDEVLAAEPGRRSEPPGVRAERTVELRKGNFRIAQLHAWHRAVLPLLAEKWAVLTDLDERRNRVVIGVRPRTKLSGLRRRLASTGVPLAAVIVEEVEPPRLRMGLRSYFDSMPGGVQIERAEMVVGRISCTAGFFATLQRSAGFVTAAHCTDHQGHVDDTEFHQPDDNWDNDNNEVGNETRDPPFFSGGSCTSTRCRYSDSAFISKLSRPVSQASIARPRSMNDGTLELATGSSFSIAGEIPVIPPGSRVSKVGRTTGWTQGTIQATCQNVVPEDCNFTLLCQGAVARQSGSPAKMCDGGDSGSPVFVELGSNRVLLAGVLWGGGSDGFWYSPIGLVRWELGADLKTFNFPEDQILHVCRPGQKCCGGPANACPTPCIPRAADCQ